jgi:hypothetical protein
MLWKFFVTFSGGAAIAFGLEAILPVSYRGWVPALAAGGFIIALMIWWQPRRRYRSISGRAHRAPRPFADPVGQVNVDPNLLRPAIRPPRAPYDELR